MKKQFKLIVACALLGLGAGGCASSRMGQTEIDSEFRSRNYDAAAASLKSGLEKEGEDGRDGLLYLLDYALALHTAGKYEESIKAFRRADSLAEIKDYTSLAAETATLLVSDNLKQYKAEEFENILINVYLAMNYALIGQPDEALVEARRVNRKLYLMVSEGGRHYQQNAFARYLSAVLFESRGEWNDAYVSYKQTRELMPEFAPIGGDLYRLALRLKITDEAARWAKEFNLTKDQQAEQRQWNKDRDQQSEIVVLYQNGASPRKIENPDFPSIPVFQPQFNPVRDATVRIFKSGGEELRESVSLPLFNIEAIAIQNLKEKWAGMLAKKIAGAAAKVAIGAVINSQTKDSGLGTMVALLMYQADRADRRSWALLPKDLQIARFRVPPGRYDVEIIPNGVQPLSRKTIEVKARGTVFVTDRYMP